MSASPPSPHLPPRHPDGPPARDEPPADDPAPVRALWQVVSAPDRFFARLSPRGGYGRPAGFALACIGVSTVLAWLATGADDPVGTGLAAPLAFDLLLFGLYCAVTHALVVLLAGGRRAGIRATFRVVAYSQVSQLVNWVPTVGLGIGLLYGSVLVVLGIRRMHDTSVRTAVMVVALPLLVGAGVAAAVLAAA